MLVEPIPQKATPADIDLGGLELPSGSVSARRAPHARLDHAAEKPEAVAAGTLEVQRPPVVVPCPGEAEPSVLDGEGPHGFERAPPGMGAGGTPAALSRVEGERRPRMAACASPPERRLGPVILPGEA